MVLRLMVPMIGFPFLANTMGWIMTEIGRQPWVVFGYQTTAEAISPNVSAGQILFSLIGFSMVFTLLAIIMINLFIREIRVGRYGSHSDGHESIDPFDQGVMKL